MIWVAAIAFNIARVMQPYESAVTLVENGNRLVLKSEGLCVGSRATGVRMKIRAKDGKYVVDVEFETGRAGTIALDSGAGARARPER